MIGFYQDAALRDLVATATPKRFLLPLAGGRKPGTLYLGDSYTATVLVEAAISAGTLQVNQTSEFPNSGSAVIYVPLTSTTTTQVVISYTGRTSNSLTGVTGISQLIPIDCVVRPNTVWRSRSNVLFLVTGSDVPAHVLVAFGLPADPTDSPRSTVFGVGGATYITPVTSIASGVENALRVDLNATILSGDLRQFSNWAVTASTLYLYQSGDVSAIPSGASGVIPVAPGYILRRDQSVPVSTRLLPANREVSATIPGFILGDYRWRDQDQIDAAAIIPTKWDADVDAIGTGNFVTGIGDNNDLEPLYLVEGTGDNLNSVFLEIQDGCYFDQTKRYFLPGTEGLEFQSGLTLSHPLGKVPAPGKPIFVGTWQLDSNKFYSVATNYRYQTGAFVADGTLQFKLNRATNTITLNQALAQDLKFIGVLGGTGTDTFRLPIHPTYSIDSMYVALGGTLGTAPLSTFAFNADTGVVVVTSVPGGDYAQGEPVYAVCNPAIAIQYEVAPQTFVKQHSYRLSTAGQTKLAATPGYSAGIWVDGALVYTLGSSFNLLVIDRATMVNEAFYTFDVAASSANASAMAAVLNALDSSKIVVVVSYGEPSANRLVGGLGTAMSNCGASAAFTSSSLCIGSAYILVGIPGIGSAAGKEYYSGSGDHDPDASLCKFLNVTEGTVPGITATAITPAADTTTDTRLLPVDLNPAFSGLTRGVVYLQHRIQEPMSIQLSCDKPIIPIPATLESIIGLIAYGPVYFNGDYAVLTAKAYGPLNGETIPNVAMRVRVNSETWAGTVNYLDPTAEVVTVTTGADGVVNMIYTPSSKWGLYIPTGAPSGPGPAGIATTTIAGDTVVLSEPVPISQLWDGTHWLVSLYIVKDNNPVYGMIDADTSLGQIPWATSGVSGTSNYKTNGQLILQTGVNPVHALDVHGNDYTSGSFTGDVVKLVYASALPTPTALGAYFLTLLQRVEISLEAVDYPITSNQIMLQMQAPEVIIDNPWLILGDAIQGRINQYRLGQNV